MTEKKSFFDGIKETDWYKSLAQVVAALCGPKEATTEVKPKPVRLKKPVITLTSRIEDPKNMTRINK